MSFVFIVGRTHHPKNQIIYLLVITTSQCSFNQDLMFKRL